MAMGIEIENFGLNSEVLNPEEKEIVVQLTRLDSATNISVLPPLERLYISLEADKLGVRGAARNHSLHPHVVEWARRDVAAAQIYLSGKPNGEGSEVSKQVDKLRIIDKKLSAMKRVVELPNVNRVLREVPHVKELLLGYLRWGTVEPLLEDLKMPCSQPQLRSVGRYLKAGTVSESLGGLTQLARRYILAKWLYGDEAPPDGKISQAAAFVLTNDYFSLPDRMRDQIRSMRTFLSRIMNKEYEFMRDGAYALPEDLAMFPKNYSGRTEDVVEAYRNFGMANYCPTTLKQYAELTVKKVQWRERMELLGLKYYSDIRLKHFNCAGLKFLEKVLISIWRRCNFELEALTVNTEDVLREAKQRMLTTLSF